MQEGRQAAAGLLNSYIEFIEDYSQIKLEQQKVQDQTFKEQYNSLSQKWNSLVSDYNSLMKKYEAIIDQNEKVANELETEKNEKQRLIDNTLQLENITLKRLWTGVQNLPTKQVIAIVTIFLGILIGSFSLGRLVERTGANNELFDLKTDNKELESDKQKLENQINIQKTTIKLQADSLQISRQNKQAKQ